jgi:hypothetical protein
VITENIFTYFFYDIILCPRGIHHKSRLPLLATSPIRRARIAEPVIIVAISDITALSSAVTIAVIISVLIFLLATSLTINGLLIVLVVVLLLSWEFLLWRLFGYWYQRCLLFSGT